MSRFDASVNFDRNNPTWKTGETLSGSLEIQAFKDFECNQITATLLWVAHGYGNSSSHTVEQSTIHRGSFAAHETKKIPFSFQLPQAPITYHGDKLNIDWYLQFQLDLPWAPDHFIEEEFTVLPGPHAGAYHPKGFPARKVMHHSPRMGIPAILSIFLLAFIGWQVYQFISNHREGVDDLQDLMLLLTMSTLGSIGAFYVLHQDRKNRIASSSFGAVEISHSPNNPRGGDTVEFTFSFTPKRSRTIRSIVTQLTAMESVISGTIHDSIDGNRLIYASLIHSHQDEQVMSDPIQLKEGHPATLKHWIVLPLMAPASFETTDNELKWIAHITIKSANSPDWEGNYEFIVCPREQTQALDSDDQL